MKSTMVILAWAILSAEVGLAGEAGSSGLPPVLRDAPVNTWVKVNESATGYRDLPIFAYVPTTRKFVLASGMQADGRDPARGKTRHYDTEEFDLASARWINAYPPGREKDRAEAGPVGEAYSKWLGSAEFDNSVLLYKDGDSLRIGAGGAWLTTRVNHLFAVVPETGRIYAYMNVYRFKRGRTICYDAAARTWQDLGAESKGKSQLWGSLCYDPVNREILHTGGDGGSADTSTWVYGIESNAWRQLEFKDTGLKGLGGPARELRWQAKGLLGACCNRFAISETEAESQVNLAVRANELAGAAEKFAATIAAAGLTGTEKTAGEAAVKRLKAAVVALREAGPGLSGKIEPATIASIRAVRVTFERVVDALAVEPPGRARSQTAYDPVHKKIVLFGGDQLDRVLSDTWVYDCATRTWEQRFPARVPAPRAGHVLAWLPRAGRIVLAGGYSRESLPQEIWTYDGAANEWKMLLHVPLKTAGIGKAAPFSPDAPCSGFQSGAVNEDDVLVCPSRLPDNQGNGLITWACKVDAARVDEAGAAARAAEAGSYTFNRIDPADWEKAAQPDAERMKQFFKDLPVNQWTAIPFSKYAPGAHNRWGTAAYDTARHQFLFWGGGHSTSHENDVSHFSVRGGCWTLGYHPDDPIEYIYATVPTPLSFHDRPHVPTHAYHSYAYDPAADRMFYLDRMYDPAVREWESAPAPGLPKLAEGRSLQIGTPHGVVCLSHRQPPFIHDAKAGQWKMLPWAEPSPRSSGFDLGGGMYDSTRDCLWVAASQFFRYDFKAGKGGMIQTVKPRRIREAGADFVLGREVVHEPDADLALVWSGGGGQGPVVDGVATSLAWSPEDAKYYWIRLPAMAEGKPVAKFTYDVSDGLAYDPKLKLIFLNKNRDYKVYALKLDRKTLEMQEAANPPEHPGGTKPKQSQGEGGGL